MFVTSICTDSCIFFLPFPKVHTLWLSYLNMACPSGLQSSLVSPVSVTSANVQELQVSHSLPAVTQESSSAIHLLEWKKSLLPEWGFSLYSPNFGSCGYGGYSAATYRCGTRPMQGMGIWKLREMLAFMVGMLIIGELSWEELALLLSMSICHPWSIEGWPR